MIVSEPRRQTQTLPRAEYRYILRNRHGADILHPCTGEPYAYPSYMAAVRGRAMLNPCAFIIQQELA